MKKILLLVFLMVVFPTANAKRDRHYHHGHVHCHHHVTCHHHHHHFKSCKCHHRPGHFYCKWNGRFKPHYQYAIFDQRRFDCKPGIVYKRAFYRYYNENGMSTEYYIP